MHLNVVLYKPRVSQSQRHTSTQKYQLVELLKCKLKMHVLSIASGKMIIYYLKTNEIYQVNFRAKT